MRFCVEKHWAQKWRKMRFNLSRYVSCGSSICTPSTVDPSFLDVAHDAAEAKEIRTAIIVSWETGILDPSSAEQAEQWGVAAERSQPSNSKARCCSSTVW